MSIRELKHVVMEKMVLSCGTPLRVKLESSAPWNTMSGVGAWRASRLEDAGAALV